MEQQLQNEISIKSKPDNLSIYAYIYIQVAIGLIQADKHLSFAKSYTLDILHELKKDKQINA